MSTYKLDADQMAEAAAVLEQMGNDPDTVACELVWMRHRLAEIRAKVEAMIGTTNIPLSAARVRMAAIEEVLEIIDGIKSSEQHSQ